MRFVVLALTVILVTACEASASPTPRAERPTATEQTEFDIIYRVLTSDQRHDISLTYQNASGNTEQQELRTERGIWTYVFKAAPGDFLYLSVQNGQDSGSVSCRIEIDGEVAESADSTGGFVIASCSGAVPG